MIAIATNALSSRDRVSYGAGDRASAIKARARRRREDALREATPRWVGRSRKEERNDDLLRFVGYRRNIHRHRRAGFGRAIATLQGEHGARRPGQGRSRGPQASAAATGGPATQGSRRIYADGGWRDAVVFAEGAIRPGFAFDGPAVVEFDDTTLIVGAGQRGEVDAHPNVTIIPKD
jgi:N-methylhydantoinase A/oxoprolinase/acetone carboxylase beta subunit